MGGFLLARVGKPITLATGKQTTGLVQLSDLAAAINTLRVYQTDKPWPIPTKAAWRPYNREPLLHISPALTVRATSVFQGYAMSLRLDIDRRRPLAILCFQAHENRRGDRKQPRLCQSSTSMHRQLSTVVFPPPV